MGQALYIVLFIILNIVLTAVNYHARQPSAWYPSRYDEIMAFVFYRTGALAYIFAPLVFLFAGRNNVLLWVTNWSHSTYLVLHRWVARVFTFQAILHSILAVVLYKNEGSYTSMLSQPYWIWGVVATIAAVILTFGSGLYVRNFGYELFLLVHIVLSVILIPACWYHAYDLYHFLGGNSIWLVCCGAVWVFDRFMRVARILMEGPREAQVTELSGDYVRIEIPGIRWGSEPGKHVFCYFPTSTPWRPWENHPFSVLSTALLHHEQSLGSASESRGPVSLASHDADVEKNHTLNPQVTALESRPMANGLTLYVRKSTGLTKSLRKAASLLTMVEGPYPSNHNKEVLRCDRLLLISGGIGITGILPFANNHWNVKLAWSVKESARCLVEDLNGALNQIRDKDVRIGSRFDVNQLLAEEVTAGWERIGVVVCGPGALCDDVRAAVSAASRQGKTEFELEVEAYSW
jgi:hypothetical protein